MADSILHPDKEVEAGQEAIHHFEHYNANYRILLNGKTEVKDPRTGNWIRVQSPFDKHDRNFIGS